MTESSNADWFSRARRVIPGGVSSPVRSFRAVGGEPFTVVRGEGPYVWDVEGRRYLDLVQSYGAVLLGHGHKAVTEALTEAVRRGTTFGAPTPGEVFLAEEICGRVEGCEQVRFVSSGTEAAMSAVRLARGVTGRALVVKFAGCYHGHFDALLAEGGSAVATLGISGSAGVPPSAVADTVVVPYNTVPDLGALGQRVACVIVEPVAANMGVVPAQPGFLAGLREACDRVGALLVFDEVITGFRLGPAAASDLLGVKPDLWCFGKVIGGGLPLAAFGGRADLLSALAPTGPVYQAGTLSGNPLATAAGLAVLREVGPDDYADLVARASRFAQQLHEALVSDVHDGGVEVQVPVVGPLVGIFFSDGEVTNYEQAKASSTELYLRFFHAMLKREVALAPGPFEAMFPGMAHDEEVLSAVVERAADAAAELSRPGRLDLAK